jgi:hypothetical protein
VATPRGFPISAQVFLGILVGMLIGMLVGMLGGLLLYTQAWGQVQEVLRTVKHERAQAPETLSELARVRELVRAWEQTRNPAEERALADELDLALTRLEEQARRQAGPEETDLPPRP